MSLENYAGAFEQRHSEFDMLCTKGMNVLAFHIAGISLECLLKHKLISFSGITNWGEKGISNPSHDLIAAISCNKKLHRLAKNASMYDIIQRLSKPLNGKSFIDLRYCAETAPNLAPRKHDYDRVIAWILKNA